MSIEHLVPFSPRLRNTRRAMRLFDHMRRIGSHLLPTTSVVSALLSALEQAEIIKFETNVGRTLWQPRDIEFIPIKQLEDCLRGDADIRTHAVLQESIVYARLFNRIVKFTAEKIWEELVNGQPLRWKNEDRIDDLWTSFESHVDEQFDEVVAEAMCPVLARYLKHMPHTGCGKWCTVEETVCYLLGMLANDRDMHGRSSLDNIWLATIDALIDYYRRWALAYATSR